MEARVLKAIGRFGCGDSTLVAEKSDMFFENET